MCEENFRMTWSLESFEKLREHVPSLPWDSELETVLVARLYIEFVHLVLRYLDCEKVEELATFSPALVKTITEIRKCPEEISEKIVSGFDTWRMEQSAYIEVEDDDS
ncbi:hypothetical protein TKK_0004444 [Trichogramma kaykai]